MYNPRLFTTAFAISLLGIIDQSLATPMDPNAQPQPHIGFDPYPAEGYRTYENYVAIGDSYSAGPGRTGDDDKMGTAWSPAPAFDKNCAQTEGSWPVQLKDAIKPEKFTFLACTGYTSEDMIKKELADEAFGDPDLVTITAGGNNGAMFIDVIKACPVSVVPNTPYCSGQIDKAEGIIADMGIALGDLYKAAGSKNKDPKTQRDVLVVGYPDLYNDKNEANFPRSNCRLAADLRGRINGLVTKLNTKINDTINAINEQNNNAGGGDVSAARYFFADPNDPKGPQKTLVPTRSFDTHRFCEPDEKAWLQGGGTGADTWADWITGMFHPKKDGFTVMKDAAQNVLAFNR